MAKNVAEEMACGVTSGMPGGPSSTGMAAGVTTTAAVSSINRSGSKKCKENNKWKTGPVVHGNFSAHC